MKFRSLFSLLLATILVFAACENGTEGTDKKPDIPEIKEPVLTLTSEATMEFTAEGGAGEISYTLENPQEGVTLTATCAAEWIADVAVGEKVAFAVAANDVTEPRETKIVVAYGDLSFEVVVKQEAKVEIPAPVLTLTSEATMEFTAEGGAGEISYTLENPQEGVTVTATCAAEWIADVAVGEKVAFAVAANDVTEPRETKIVVAYGDLSFEVAVKQEAKVEIPAPVLTLTSEATMEFTAEGGAGEISYTLENPQEGVTVTATCAAEWVADVAVGEKVAFAVAANDVTEPRETKVIVAYGDLSFEVAVKQEAKVEIPAPVLTLTSEATMEFTAEGGAGEISYTLENPQEGVTVTATCAAEWVADVAVGEKVTFAVVANDVTEPRETKVVVAYGDLSFEVTVKQAAMIPEPETFEPIRVVAYRESYWEVGNFELRLFINDTLYHSLDINDKGNPNNNYLSADTYTMSDGAITSYSEFVVNVDTGDKVEVVAAEVTLSFNAGGTSTLVGFFESERGHHLDVNWTGVIEGFNFDVDEGGDDEGGTDDGGNEEDGSVTVWEIKDVDWGWISESANDIVLKTATVNGTWNTFNFELKATVTNNKLPDGTYSTVNGTLVLKYCTHTVNGNKSSMTEAVVIITNNSNGTTTIDANWTANDARHQASWTGVLPEYEL